MSDIGNDAVEAAQEIKRRWKAATPFINIIAKYVLFLEEKIAQKAHKPEDPSNIICPVCGTYCIGKGGFGCIDKPGAFPKEKTMKPFIELKVDESQVWIFFDTGNNKQAMVNLNNIVLGMNSDGFTRNICIEAIRRTLAEKQTVTSPAVEVERLAMEIADKEARNMLEYYKPNEEGWLCDNSMDGSLMKKSIRYLIMRGLVIQHTDHDDWIRIKE